MSTDPVARSKRAATRWSIASNGLLLAAKLAIAVFTGSMVVLAEMVNSAGDLVGSVVSWLAVRISDEPPDDSHAYGHGKIENLSAALTAGLVLAGGFYALLKSILRLVSPERLAPVGLDWAIAVMVLSAITDIWVSRRLLAVARETDSPALQADGIHLRTDVWTSTGALVGLVLARVSGQTWWDPAAAIFVSLVILRSGYVLAGDSLRTLADVKLPAAEEKLLGDVLLAHPEVLGFHKLRTRKAGSHRLIDVHVQIADTHTFVEAHRLTEDLEDALSNALPNVHPIIHIEPHDEEKEHQRIYHQSQNGRSGTA